MTRPRAERVGRRPVGDLHVHDQAFQVRAVSERFWGPIFSLTTRCGVAAACRGRLLQAEGDEDGLGHPLVQGSPCSPGMVVQRIMEDAHDGGVAADEDPGDAPAAPAVRPGRSQFHQHLVALHRAIHLVGRNEDVVVTASLAGLRTDEAEAVPMHIQTAGEQVVAGGCLGQRPVIAVRL